ncbi:hypothetical protein EON64_14155 [archaeon]|nr:MAG: hypothetical protein EON64_14155 [archaeon]
MSVFSAANAARKRPRSERTVLHKVIRKAKGLKKASASMLAGSSFIFEQLSQHSSKISSKQSSAKSSIGEVVELEDQSFSLDQAADRDTADAMPQFLPGADAVRLAGTEANGSSALGQQGDAEARFARAANVVKTAKQLLSRKKVYAEKNKDTATPQDDPATAAVDTAGDMDTSEIVGIQAVASRRNFASVVALRRNVSRQRLRRSFILGSSITSIATRVLEDQDFNAKALQMVDLILDGLDDTEP